jgi:2-dehydro-3-deoxyphosphogluconate aldolase/(4S)-4-hydroxy-2-oxoglutarate aldolase
MSIPLESEVANRMEQAGVVAVLVIDRKEDAVPLARALMEGGVTGMELTLRTPAALDSLKAIRDEVPEMLAGIGTILTTEQVDQVVDAGAAFGVAPGTNPRVIQHAQHRGLPFGPGIATPSDIEQALELGCRLLKYFPAETLGGLKHLGNMAAPYNHLGLRYIPLGGIKTSNMVTYLQSPLIHAIGGSWLAPRDVIAAQDWATITRTASEATTLLAEARGS